MLEFGAVDNDDSFPEGVVLRSAHASEHLKHNPVGSPTQRPLSGLHLSTLGSSGMGRQINAPCESHGANKDLNGTISEEFFNKAAILPLW
jgi:hypothetical protein